MCCELTLHDSRGDLISTFWWHRDDTAAEAGSIEDGRAMKRTIIWVLDRCSVNQIHAVHMSHDRSDWSSPGSRDGLEEGYVQRKIVMHTRSGLSEPRVDWGSMIPSSDRVQYDLAMVQPEDLSRGFPSPGCAMCRCGCHQRV